MNLSDFNDLNPVVCGTDFSAGAAQAALVAGALAERGKRRLIVVHSVDERGQFPPGVRHRLVEEGAPRLAREAVRLRARGLVFEEKLLSGLPDDGVAAFAAKVNASLVVVSASGTGALGRSGRWVLGNTAERIAETSPVPTLIVRAEEPFLKWARGERVLTVFVAVDFTATSDAALRWLAEWRQIGRCDVTLGHIAEPAELQIDPAVAPGAPGAAPAAEAQRMIEAELRERATRLLGGEAAIRVVPRGGNVDAQIIELASEAGADLIVLGTHQRHGLERLWHASISRRILQAAPLSVACVPVAAALSGAVAKIPVLSRVLVATDFSEPGDRAVPQAYALVPEGGTVFLIHVVQPMPGAGVAARTAHLAQLREATARLRTLIHGAAAPGRIASEEHVVEHADPATAICEAAERFGADVICLGSHGRSGIVAALLGSVAHAVLARSHRPVLVVPPPAG